MYPRVHGCTKGTSPLSVHGICPLWRCLSNAIHYGTSEFVLASMLKQTQHAKSMLSQCCFLFTQAVYLVECGHPTLSLSLDHPVNNFQADV